jgi:hypothetical protein
MKSFKFLSTAAIAASYMLSVANPIMAVTPVSYLELEQQTGAKGASNIPVYPGRISSVDFSSTDEVISYIGLGDSSKIVFNTDLPIESGAAKSIFLRPIQTLKFPGATTTPITNLVVKTMSDDGKSRLYNFNIVHSKGNPANLGIQIVTQTQSGKQGMNASMKTDSGRTVNLNDVQRGLQTSIAKGYTDSNDPIVYKVKRFLVVARNQNLSMIDAANAAGVDLAIINELAMMSFEAIPQVPTIPPTTKEEAPLQTKTLVAQQPLPSLEQTTKIAQQPSGTVDRLEPVLKAESLPNNKPKENKTVVAPLPPKLQETKATKPPLPQPSPNPVTQLPEMDLDNSVKLANDLVYGLGVAAQKKQINYGTQMYRKINSVIAMVRRGKTVEKAASVAGVPMSTISQVRAWGQTRIINSTDTDTLTATGK